MVYWFNWANFWLNVVVRNDQADEDNPGAFWKFQNFQKAWSGSLLQADDTPQEKMTFGIGCSC